MHYCKHDVTLEVDCPYGGKQRPTKTTCPAVTDAEAQDQGDTVYVDLTETD